MTKQEQIEEIKQVLIKTCKRCRSSAEDYMQSNYAEALYNAGYRKVFSNKDNFTDLLNEEIKELSLIERTRKETAKEFAERLEQICADRWEWFYDEKIDMEIHRAGRVGINDIEKLLKEYAKREWEYLKI